MRRPLWTISLLTTALATGVLTAAPANAVSGGTPAADGSYTFVAKLTNSDRACTGALVAAQWVITAGSCLPDNTKPTTVTVAGKVAHVSSLVPRSDRNVVLAKLDTPITDVAPIAIGTTAPANGESLRVAGYGRTATEWVPDRFATAVFTASTTTDSTLALTSATGNDTCKGDAGGPAFRETAGKVELVGINSTSWQHGCLAVTETRQGSTESRVDNIADWIRQHTVPTEVRCSAGAPMWLAKSDGTLWLYTHSDPTGGTWAWNQPQSAIGNGWFGRMLAGPHGVVWDFHKKIDGNDPFNDGDLKRWVWDGQHWSGGNQVGNGWQRYLTPEYRNRITVDQQGRIFMINDQGELRVFVWNEQTNNWVNGIGDVVDTGWGRFDSITAAGDGVLYARTPEGNLFRFQYDFTAHNWVQRDKAAGVGWQMFSEIFSPGGDILYGRGAYGRDPWSGANGPVLRWYRHTDNTDDWAPGDPDGGGKVVGTGWDTEIHVSAVPDSCTLVK